MSATTCSSTVIAPVKVTDLPWSLVPAPYDYVGSIIVFFTPILLYDIHFHNNDY